MRFLLLLLLLIIIIKEPLLSTVHKLVGGKVVVGRSNFLSAKFKGTSPLKANFVQERRITAGLAARNNQKSHS